MAKNPFLGVLRIWAPKGPFSRSRAPGRGGFYINPSRRGPVPGPARRGGKTPSRGVSAGRPSRASERALRTRSRAPVPRDGDRAPPRGVDVKATPGAASGPGSRGSGVPGSPSRPPPGEGWPDPWPRSRRGTPSWSPDRSRSSGSLRLPLGPPRAPCPGGVLHQPPRRGPAPLAPRPPKGGVPPVGVTGAGLPAG